MDGKVIRVNSWKGFKYLLIKHNVREIAYNIEMGIPARHLTVLRLILPIGNIRYVFIDTASGGKLRKTGMPLSKDKMGNMHIRGEDVIKFIRLKIGGKEIRLHSYWSM